MILTPRIVIRLVLLGVLTVLVQISFFGRLSLIGASPDVTPLVVMTIGLLGGTVSGAVAGFGIGLLLDCLLLQTMGASGLALLGVGYISGRYREGFGRPRKSAVALLGGGLTMFYVTAFGAIQIGLGVEADVSALVIRDAIVKSVLGGLLAVPVYLGIRLLLRPALIDDRPSARRPFAPRPLDERS
ncbi:MAG: rod shape-determining protein MreD [Solirubrobacterales bacterium]|nr:rod shape-determining protein MreD [Solirubrobacterales bacterium]